MCIWHTESEGVSIVVHYAIVFDYLYMSSLLYDLCQIATELFTPFDLENLWKILNFVFKF